MTLAREMVWLFQLNNVSLIYTTTDNHAIEALYDINLTIIRGERLVIIGPSGSGKTSLLLLLAGLLPASRGHIFFNESPLNGPQAKMSLVLQDYGLFPWKTVLENAMLGLTFKKTSTAESIKIVHEILNILGISQLLHKYPGQLSGGERQRVAIARALATQPDYLLMDEPFSALDALTREQLQDLMLELWNRLHFTIVLVTHSIEEAVFLGSRIAVLSPSPGHIMHICQNGKRATQRNSSMFYSQCCLIRSLLEYRNDV